MKTLLTLFFLVMAALLPCQGVVPATSATSSNHLFDSNDLPPEEQAGRHFSGMQRPIH